jgi:hypothetical protein
MAQTLCVIPPAEDCARLAAIVGDRNRPHKHIQRARIILFPAERLTVAEVAQRAGVEGLLRDKTRPPGRPPLPVQTVAKVLALTCCEPPGEATHWTGRAMAKKVGISS